MATDLQREHMKGLMDWLVRHEPLIDYAQARPMRTRNLTEQELAETFKAGHHITMDCSEAVTLVCRMAGLSDPNGLAYNGAGYTGTLLERLPHYFKPQNAKVGALVVFGAGTGEHVCTVVMPGANPLLFSHGQNAGPIFIRLTEEAKYHHPPVTFLDISHL